MLAWCGDVLHLLRSKCCFAMEGKMLDPIDVKTIACSLCEIRAGIRSKMSIREEESYARVYKALYRSLWSLDDHEAQHDIATDSIFALALPRYLSRAEHELAKILWRIRRNKAADFYARQARNAAKPQISHTTDDLLPGNITEATHFAIIEV